MNKPLPDATAVPDVVIRHSLADRVAHWANAALWLLLFLTGLALFDGESAPLGQWYPDLVRGITGGGGTLLSIHLGLGFVWMLCLLVYIVTNIKGIRSFLYYVLRLFPGDGAWMLRKPFHLALGIRLSSKLGVPSEIPPQSFYNVGQRGYAVCAVLGCLCLAVTGLMMFAGTRGWFSPDVLGWCVTLHFLAAGLLFAFLIIHFYMAALVKEERPGLMSMFSGTVPGWFARCHHTLWYQDVVNAEKAQKK